MEIAKLIGNIILVTVETVALLCVAVYRFPIRALIVAVLVASSVLLGFHTTVSIVFYVPLLLGAWWLTGLLVMRLSGGARLEVLAAYRSLVGRHVHRAWRRWRLYERRWQRTLAGQHLTEIVDRGYDEVPKLSKVAVTPSGDLVRVKVLPGQTAVNYVGLDGQTARNLAKAFKARECRVTDIPQTDYITLELPRGKDPLADVVPFPGIPKTAGDIDLRRIPIGIDERGRTVTIPLLGAHVMIGGITGAGKGSDIWSIILHLEPLIRDGSVRLWLADPKRGVELYPGRNLAYRYADTDEAIAEMLAEAVTVMDDKSAALKAAGLRKITPSPETPLDVIVVDELGRLSEDKACTASLKTLVNVGRAPGCCLVGALQNPTKETAKWRDEVPVKIALKLESADYVKMLLGRLAYLAGARCDEIPLSMPGVGYVKVDELADELADTVAWWQRLLPWTPPGDASTSRPPSRFRAFWVPNELIEAANARFAPDAGGQDEDVAVVA